MTVKEFLKKYKRMEDVLRIKTEKLRRLESAVVYTSPAMTDMPHPPSDPALKRSAALAALMDLEVEVEKSMEECLKINRRVMEMFDTIHDCDVKWVMYARYVNGLSWKVISADLGKTERWTLHLHGDGLKELSDRFGHNLLQ